MHNIVVSQNMSKVKNVRKKVEKKKLCAFFPLRIPSWASNQCAAKRGPHILMKRMILHNKKYNGQIEKKWDAMQTMTLNWSSKNQISVNITCEHHLDAVSIECPIHSQCSWEMGCCEPLLMKHGSMSLTQNQHSWILIAISQFDLLWKISLTYQHEIECAGK